MELSRSGCTGYFAAPTLVWYTRPPNSSGRRRRWTDHFWNHAGAHGTLTLFDWLGVSPPVAVLLAVLLALGMFAGGEAVERWLARRDAAEVQP